jgi:hypothetical protein
MLQKQFRPLPCYNWSRAIFFSSDISWWFGLYLCFGDGTKLDISGQAFPFPDFSFWLQNSEAETKLFFIGWCLHRDVYNFDLYKSENYTSRVYTRGLYNFGLYKSEKYTSWFYTSGVYNFSLYKFENYTKWFYTSGLWLDWWAGWK